MRLKSTVAVERDAGTRNSAALVMVGIAIVLVPTSALIAIRLGNTKIAYAQPVCANGLDSVVIRPGRSTLLLPLVRPGEETVFPLRVRADHLAQRLPKSVENRFEFRREPGTTLVWGIRLGRAKFGEQIFFLWKGKEPTRGEVAGFCIRRSEDPRSSIGTAVSLHDTVPVLPGLAKIRTIPSTP